MSVADAGNSERVVDLNSVRHFLEILAFVRDEKAKLTEAEVMAKAAIQNVLGDSEIGALDGTPVVKWSTIKTVRLSQSTLRRDYPDAAANCMETSVSRKFTVLG